MEQDNVAEYSDNSFIYKYIKFARYMLLLAMFMDGVSTYMFMSRHIPEGSNMTPLPGIIPPISELRNSGRNFYADLSGILYCLELMLGCKLLGRVTGPYFEAFTLTFIALTWGSLAYTNIASMLGKFP